MKKKMLVTSSFPQTKRFFFSENYFAIRAFALGGVRQPCHRSKKFRDGLPRTPTCLGSFVLQDYLVLSKLLLVTDL